MVNKAEIIACAFVVGLLLMVAAMQLGQGPGPAQCNPTMHVSCVLP